MELFTTMTIGSILLGLALLFVVVLFLARPFIAGNQAEDETRSEAEIADLETLLFRKERLLREIKELDEDAESAKIAPELYQRRRAEVVMQAALVMQQIDAQYPAADTDLPDELDVAIEAAVRRRREAKPAAPDDRSGGYCPQCGRPVDPDDHFCASCGHTLLDRSDLQTARA